MKKFLQNSLLFFTLSLLISFVLIILTYFLCRFVFDFNISKDKNILIIGDSHPQYAINDDIILNTFNLAQGGSGYFYSYMKIREVVNRNSHIDTIVLGYTYTDLLKERDFLFDSDDKIKFKLRNHFFLFNKTDYLALFDVRPFKTLTSTPQTICFNIAVSLCGYPCLGRYKYTEENKVKEAKEKDQKRSKKDSLLDHSLYQVKYLLAIYEYCQSKKIKLILLNVPIHPHLENLQINYKQQYCDFPKQKMPNATVINHSNLKIPESGYRDLGHLNSIGAKIYSDFLKKNQFKYSLQ